MSALTIFGIKSCDTCRKALKWLDAQGHDYRWHDFRLDGLEPERLQGWLSALGAEVLINRRSTTWRTLSADERAQACNPAQAAALILTYPTLIKRPVIEQGDRVMVGFDAAVRDSL